MGRRIERFRRPSGHLQPKPRIRDAILYGTGPYGWALRAAIACDTASVEELDATRVEVEVEVAAFRTAVQWADAMMVA